MNSNPTVQARRRYQRSLGIAIAVYVVVLIGSVIALQHGLSGTLRLLVAMLPALPVAGVFYAGVRYLMETDEFERTTMVTSLAIAGALTGLLSVTYGFLQNAGFPHPSAWWTWGCFAITWAVSTLFVRRSYE